MVNPGPAARSGGRPRLLDCVRLLEGFRVTDSKALPQGTPKETETLNLGFSLSVVIRTKRKSLRLGPPALY